MSTGVVLVSSIERNTERKLCEQVTQCCHPERCVFLCELCHISASAGYFMASDNVYLRSSFSVLFCILTLHDCSTYRPKMGSAAERLPQLITFHNAGLVFDTCSPAISKAILFVRLIRVTPAHEARGGRRKSNFTLCFVQIAMY